MRNTTTKDNPGTLPINLYAAESLAIQPLDFTVLSEAAAVSVPPRETIETFLQTKPMGPLQLGSRDHIFPKNLLYYGL